LAVRETTLLLGPFKHETVSFMAAAMILHHAGRYITQEELDQDEVEWA